MLNARNAKNTAQTALISGLHIDLVDHKKKLQEVLDGQQAIREEYVDMSSELTYEFKLHNPRAILSYMGSQAFVERLLAQGKALLESQMETDQVLTYREGSSSGIHDEELADPPMEEVASHDTNHQVRPHGDDGAELDSVDLNLTTPDSAPAHI
uniref:Uncharacterized protein n=1 Tax=Cannabis sativa TaxID=3483 RepID=A0A803PYL2_CANSA